MHDTLNTSKRDAEFTSIDIGTVALSRRKPNQNDRRMKPVHNDQIALGI